jgi:exodeoxyribonuclease VII large subunit
MRSSVEAPILTVSAFAAQIDRAVRSVGGAVIEGEVQKPQKSRKGLLYFDLTDGDSTLSCKVFGRQIPRLRHEPAEGDLIRVRVERPDFWTTAGRLSLIVAEIELAGAGELLRKRAELLEKLRAEGLCDPDRRKPLPRFPRAVGVIAGKSSDGMSDVIRAIQDRFPPAHIVACPALVQGKAAPRDIIDALALLQEHPRVDVIVIARGGGSVHDLVAFDDQRLCRAVFACETPVITAIGHTDNVPVCNHVTHAAPTPSRSAELAIPSMAETRANIETAQERLEAAPKRRSEDVRAAVAEQSRWLGNGIARQLSDHERDYEHAIRRLLADVGGVLVARPAELQTRLTQAGRLFRERVDHRLAYAEQSAGRLAALIAARDFRRHGYVLATDQSGKPISSVADAPVGARLGLNFRDGEALVSVEKTKESKQ